jgi:hypothetical protein
VHIPHARALRTYKRSRVRPSIFHTHGKTSTPVTQLSGIMHGTVVTKALNTDDSRNSMSSLEQIVSRRESLSHMAEEVQRLEKKSTFDRRQKSLREKVHMCCTDGGSSRIAFIWEWSLALLIVLSVIFYAFETFATKPAQRPGYPSYEAFAAGEIFFTFMFLGELIVRGVACPYLFSRPDGDPDMEAPFFRDGLNLLDFIAILPWFLEKIFQPDTSPTTLNLEFEIIKLLRVLRVFKIFRAFSGTRILVETAQKSLKPLSLTLMMLFMFMTVVASIIFMIEPCVNSNCVFKDTFNTGYFIAITLTTVGYGDQVPTHSFARFFAVVTMLFGAIFLSMPIAVIGNKFELAYNAYEKRESHKNPEAALATAKHEYQARIQQRRKRIIRGLFSMMYDIQCTESILRQAEEMSKNKDITATSVRGEEAETPPVAAGADGEKTNHSKYAISTTARQSQRHHATGPAAASLTQLSRKHHFARVDIRQLFRSDKIDASLPKHIQNLMHKITNDGIEIDETDVTDESEKEESPQIDPDEDPRGTKVTKKNTMGVQAFDILEKNIVRHRREADVREARKRNSCRDKTWIVLEVHASSRLAYYVYIGRWLVLLVSVVIMMLSTFPEMHAYGESSPYCQRLLSTYCNKINNYAANDTRKAIWKETNPACFAWTKEEMQTKHNISATSDYAGCLDSGTCAFPSPEHNMTCAHNVLFGNTEYPCKKHPGACAERLDYTNSIYSLMLKNTPVCQRTPCVDNVNVPTWTGGKSAGDFAPLWGTIELILLVYFFFEYATRVFVARDIKTFFREHIWLLIFTMMIVVEFVIVVAYRSGLRYDPWGFGPLDMYWDTHRLRPLRVLVPLRFCAFSSDFRGIKVAALTVEKVAGRMMTPSLFFIVFMVLFGGMMYVFELLQCKAMEVPDGSGNLKWYYMNQNGEDDCTVQDMFDAIWIIVVT